MAKTSMKIKQQRRQNSPPENITAAESAVVRMHI